MTDYKLVPVEPTPEMIDAALKSDHAEISPRKIVEQDYKAMLAAAPAAPLSGDRKDLIREVFMRNGFTIKPGCDDLREYVYKAAFELLELATPPVPMELVVWPLASKEEAVKGWNLDYRFLEQVEKVASQRTDFTTSMEAVEQVLIAATELLRAPQPAEQQESGHGD